MWRVTSAHLPPLLANATPLLPDRAGLLLIYAAVGCLGGVAAAAHQSELRVPSLWSVLQRAIVGLATGGAAGMLGLAKLGVEDSAFYWTMFASMVSGFVGPVWVWQLGQAYLKLTRPNLPPLPPMPPLPTPPKQGDAP